MIKRSVANQVSSDDASETIKDDDIVWVLVTISQQDTVADNPITAAKDLIKSLANHNFVIVRKINIKDTEK